ncbi:hypothetical protein Nepgr_002879 [Nepenthes gracilis]|uniref:Uncharacterized protein n=1 Tax=Nepenthes gracilis TaxID=150966 RepID=A0AAD3RYL3_NEPGR|nr:hypothetical protein Nepgr_002879 [Nepenthes gracilis]
MVDDPCRSLDRRQELVYKGCSSSHDNACGRYRILKGGLQAKLHCAPPAWRGDGDLVGDVRKLGWSYTSTPQGKVISHRDFISSLG